MSRAIVAIFAIVIVGAVSVYALGFAAESAGVNHEIDDETFEPVGGQVTTLDHSNLDHTTYDESVEVYDNNGDLVDPQNDYIWFEDNGTIKTVSGGDLDGENSATIDYAYQTTTDDQRALIGITAMFPTILGVLAPLLGVALLFIFLRG
ncbi:MAG: hypothetical protein RI568_14405 [Natronomonas sp.]|uniref:hypothetical protein n=1 Tax=Natronomonas sp. TaxID=2184060 RepID=UPI00286FC661|nr:hypothetical protein [Natronomonas sp.]MDR9431874.1 hypothetical protein [Natronomonas sp.]